MNANQLINMIARMFVRKAMRFGMKAGSKTLSSTEIAGRTTPQDQRRNNSVNQDAKRARKAMRMTKKITRL